jgi:hypothetical protein
MPHGDLQILEYDMGDKHTITPKIKKDIKFEKGLSVKLNSGNRLKTELISSVWTLETNTL